ncbi:hypothetical protein [Kangiella sediminilitoris]|uniref:Apea-like HEPN domain-containing protein n=1 Tax=Kangiella sediminilitoris TaxID=1144748 RepID=A0A1B3BCJ2_9GAMM|nr:hypothetical protein [Kangiella sediminilitoris]AOE50529.1 hypothetical protein KS2013_1820 [Kangiella sediminilitoris]
MSLHPHVNDFYEEWLRKSESYSGEQLADYFNKAFSLFTLYNKLYAEAAFVLARSKEIKLNGRIPDRKAATKFVPIYIGHERILEIITRDGQSNESLESLISSIENQRFYIKLSMPYGRRQPNKDKKLLASLRSTDSEEKVEAILDLIYTVRCNMFHGHKQFEEVQVELLRPVTVILKTIILELYSKLSNT